MRILLICLDNNFGTLSHGVLSVADALYSKGNVVKVIGSRKNMLRLVTSKQLMKIVDSFNPGIIGLSAMTFSDYYIALACNFLKNYFPDIPIISGGYHSLVEQEKILFKNQKLDFVFYGEAEDYFPRFINQLENEQVNFSEIKGLIYRRGIQIIKNELPEPADFSQINPYRAYRLLSQEIFKEKPTKKRSFTWEFVNIADPIFSFLLARGCPYRCSFCQLYPKNPFAKMRYLPLERFREQLEYALKYNSKIKSIFIHDSAFNLNKNWAYKIMDVIEEYDQIVEWACQIRPNLVTEEFVARLHKKGCTVVNMYIESGTDRVRNKILHKQVTNKQIRIAFRLVKKYGLYFRTNLIIGNPTESEKELNKGIRFLNSLEPDYATFPILEFYPGTRLWNKYESKLSFKKYSDLLHLNHFIGSKLRPFNNKKTYLGEIKPERLYKIFHFLHNHFVNFATLCRSLIRLKDKSLLVIQSSIPIWGGIHSDFARMVQYLDYYELDHGIKSMDLLYQKNLEVDELFLSKKVHKIVISKLPFTLKINHKLWQKLAANNYDTIVVPVTGIKIGGITRFISYAMKLRAKRLFVVDIRKRIIYQYNLRSKVLSQVVFKRN